MMITIRELKRLIRQAVRLRNEIQVLLNRFDERFNPCYCEANQNNLKGPCGFHEGVKNLNSLLEKGHCLLLRTRSKPGRFRIQAPALVKKLKEEIKENRESLANLGLEYR